MGDNAVALAAIGLASTSVLGVLWIAKYSVKKLSKDFGEHTKAAIGIKQVIADQSSNSSDQIKSNEYVAKALIMRVEADKALVSAIDKNSEKSDEAIKVSIELSTFMKRLNGTLPRSIEEKQAIKIKEKV